MLMYILHSRLLFESSHKNDKPVFSIKPVQDKIKCEEATALLKLVTFVKVQCVVVQ